MAEDDALNAALDQFTQEQNDQTTIKATSSMHQAITQNPDEIARYNAIARKTGFDPLLIATDPQVKVEAERRARMADANIPGMVQTHPKTASALTDANLAALAQDDIGTLQNIENAFVRGLKGTLRGGDADTITESAEILNVIGRIQSGELDNYEKISGATRYASLFAGVGGTPEAIAAKRANLERRLAENAVEFARRTAEMQAVQPSIEYEQFQKAEGVGDVLGAFFAAPAKITSEIVAESTGAIVPSVPLIISGGAAAGAKGLATATGLTSAGTEYANALSGILIDMGVNLADPKAVREAMTTSKFIEANRQAMIKAGVVGAFDAATAGLAGKVLGKTVARNIAAQTGVQAAGGAAGEALGSVAAGQEVSLSAVLAEAIGEAPGGAVDVGLLAIRSAVKNQQVRAEEAIAKAEDAHIALTEISKTATESKLRERDPARFKEFVQSMVEDSDLKEVFVDGTALQNTLAQSPVEVQQKFAQDMPGVMAQIEEAVNTGGTVRMPIEDYATHIAGTEIDAAILPNLKTDVAGMTYAEVQEQVKTQTAEMTDEAARILAEKEQDKEFQADAAKVYDTLLQRVESAQRFSPDANKKYAALQQAYFITRAKKLGIKPSELLARFNVQVQAERTGGAAEMEQRPQVETPEFKRWFGDSKVVDAEGKPLVVYRAISGEYKEQNRHQYWTDSVAAANEYASAVDEFGSGSNIVKAHLRIVNPFYLRSDDDAQELAKLTGQKWDSYQPYWDLVDNGRAAKELAKQGYDGIVMDDAVGPHDHISYITFDATQIKSATGNIGTFDPNDPNILRQTSSNYGYRARERARIATLEDFTPARVGNLLRKTKWAILTAENPNAQQLSAEENAQRNADLKADLDALGVQYADHEKGVAVAGITRAQALDLGAKYGQETVLTPEGLLHQDGTTEPALSIEAFAPRQVVGEDRVGSVDAAAVYFAPQPKEILPAGRVEFYVDEGRGIRPRLGSGVFWHELTLANIYDGAKNPLGFPAEPEAFEAAVAKAGFDGYVKSQDGQGVGIFLSADEVQVDIPPPILGAMERADMLYQADTIEFFASITLRFLKDNGFESAIDSEGNIHVFHGTAQKNASAIEKSGKFKGFPFFSPDKKIAEKFSRQAGGRPVVMDIVIDPGAVLPTGGYLSARMEGLTRGTDGVWRLSQHISDPKNANILYQALNEVAETLPPTGKLEQQDLADLRKLWAIYAQAETAAQYGTTQVKAFADDAPGLQRSLTDTLDAVMRGMADTSVKNITKWHEGTQRLPSGGFAYEIVSGNSSAAVYLDMADRSIQIDITRWGEGRGGSGVYKAVLDFARANGFVFHGDAQGISVAGIKRRLENLLSHALQSGDTSYMRLHPKQIEFIEQETGLKIEWTNDSKNNVEQMLNASYNLANLDIPELKNVYFDFIQKQFVARDTGAPADLAGLVAKARRNADAVRREGAPGMATVKRTVLANTLLSAQGENRRRVFADMARLSLEPVPGTGRLLYQSEAGGKFISPPDVFQQKHRGTFNPDTLTISLLKDADLTTFLHETGHFFLETESALASDLNAPQGIRDDFQKTLDWFGIPDLATWNTMSFEQKRPYHERFARGFEAYLLEGRAPSNELRSIFASFKAWLLHVYRIITNLNVELTDEVRGVFDRMLASEEEIAAVQERAGMTAAMIEAADEEAKKAYVALDTGAGDDATDELQRRSLRDMKWLSNAKSDAMKKLQREAASKRKAVRAEVTAEVEAEPINQARAFLRKGITVDPTTGDSIQATEGFRMNREIVAQMYPETMLARPDLSKLRGMTEKDGLHPDLVADMFGFRSGDALIRELIDGENPRDKIAGLTDQRMLERYGDLVDENAIEAAANEAVHNDARARFMATGLKMLSKSKLPVSQIQKAAMDAANATIAAKRVRDLHPAKYIAAETKANREVLKTAAKDVKAAQRAQRAALLNNRLAKAAQEAQEEVRKGVDRLNRTQKAAAQANMRGEYLIQLNELLARFDLRKSTTLKELDAKRTPLADWLTEESERLSAVVPDIPAWILNESNRRSYKELTIEEFRGLVDAVKQLEMMARREEEQYQAIRGMKFREERKAILDRIREFHPEAFSLDGEPLGMSPKFVKHLGDKVEEIGEKFMGEFLNAETLVSLLEGGNFGQVHESLLGRMSKRADWKATRLGDIYRKMAPLFGQYSVKERYDFARADIGAPIGMSLTRENALVVALLHGNTEGRERLANYGWNQKQQQGIINLLDERDMRLAEGIWDLFDNDLWPDLKALNERTRGKAPPKVVAIEVEHKGKTYRGGYFRLKYDTNLDERAYRLDEGAAVKELLGGGLGMSAKTGQGASTERKQNVTMRPRLDLGVFAEAVAETVHDLAYREAVADTMRLLNDVRVQNTIKTAAGVPTYRALITRVREIAAPPRNPAGFIEKTLSVARKNTIVTLMSGVNTALQNFTGFISATARVNPGKLAKEIALFYSPQMTERYDFAMKQSEYMRNRHNAFERDLQNEIKKMTVNANIMPDTGTWLTLMSLVDKGTSVPVWNAAFAEGMVKFENDNGKAVDYADHVVRQSQGSGRELDVAQIMSGHGGYGQLKRVFTMFYSYFNAQLGMLVRSGVISAKAAKANPATAVAHFTKDFMVIVILPAVLTKMIFKGGGDDEDPEEWLHTYGHAIVMYGMAMIPLVRDIGSFAWASFDHDVKNYGYKITPVQAAGEGMVKGAVAARDITIGEGDDRDLKNLIMGTSYTVGLPGKLISDTTLGTKAFLEGEAPPTAVVFGPPKK